MAKEWGKVQRYSNGVYHDVCGMRRVGGQRKMGREWWNEEVGRAVAEKRRVFEEWLQKRDRVTYDKCRAQRVVVIRAVKVAKRRSIGE